MYAGHFAAAYAIKAREPKVPTWALLVGVVALDLGSTIPFVCIDRNQIDQFYSLLYVLSPSLYNFRTYS